MKRVLAIAVLLAAAAAPVAGHAQDARPVFGAGRGDQDQARKGVREGRLVPLSSVIAAIAARAPGRQLNTTMGESGGRTAYFVQWQRQSDGRVVVFVVDAENGQILGQQGG
jgi:uncharacterized membrane protein YkoI